ncbi:fibronectin type III domain-containing protein [Psychromonas hadalis]|uniref:fibronectin type III domain-containing protein n=1 Tax=Psychromonas hadalis TaxID=211669 RepID=UPI0003B5A7BD|nr:fibronectin type III domain-containing protein [Psychromonas hadalis]
MKKWLHNGEGIDNEDGFKIERSIAGEDNFVVITTVAKNSFSYRDKSLEAEQTYCCRISSFNQMGRDTVCLSIPSMLATNAK